MLQGCVNVAVVGLGFGSAFVPIYLRHPCVGKVVVYDLDTKLTARVAADSGAEEADAWESILADKRVDAVHIVTTVPFHEDMAVECLQAGKHCACAVPMATSLKGIRRVFDAAHLSGLNYMMMETGAYTKEFLFARDMKLRGEFGRITYLRGDYFQDLDAPYPDYWRDVPPMHYATHTFGPILALAGRQAQRVSCIGAGFLERRPDQYVPNPYPLQTAVAWLGEGEPAVQVSRAWYQAAKEYVESFSAYGTQRGFEWQQLEGDDPVVFELEPVQAEHRWRGAPGRRVVTPPRPDLLPPELAEFADGGHGGSHPHLVHEFICSIFDGREPAISARDSAAWTAVGICAHESSLLQGAWVDVPQY